MLLKNSPQALLILVVIANASVAQAPLWFDTNTTTPQTSQSKPAHAVPAANEVPWMNAAPWDTKWTKQPAPVEKLPKWVDTNKVEANANAPKKTESSVAIAKPPTQDAKPTASTAKTVAPIAVTPWSAVLEADQQPTKSYQAANTAKKTESADEFLKRAESQLKLGEVSSKPIAVPKLLPTPIAPSLTPSQENTISTKLSSRALQSGEIERDYAWAIPTTQPTSEHTASEDTAARTPSATPTVPAQSAADEALTMAAFNEVSGPVGEESLIPPLQTSLAVWQDDEAKNTKDNATTSPSDSMRTSAKTGDKFQTATMIGPMANTQQLFSMLEVKEPFQTYAETVNAARTREMDSPMHAAYTYENYTWISPVFYHKPLYFEQPNLERYGQGANRFLQPAASSIHFFGTIPLLPYKMLTQHPCEKHYTLGNRRPGNCNPVQRRVVLGQSTIGEVREYWRDGSGY